MLILYSMNGDTHISWISPCCRTLMNLNSQDQSFQSFTINNAKISVLTLYSMNDYTHDSWISPCCRTLMNLNSQHQDFQSFVVNNASDLYADHVTDGWLYSRLLHLSLLLDSDKPGQSTPEFVVSRDQQC